MPFAWPGNHAQLQSQRLAPSPQVGRTMLPLWSAKDVKSIPSLMDWLTNDFVPLVRRQIYWVVAKRQRDEAMRPSPIVLNTLPSCCSGTQFCSYVATCVCEPSHAHPAFCAARSTSVFRLQAGQKLLPLLLLGSSEETLGECLCLASPGWHDALDATLCREHNFGRLERLA